MRRVFQEGTRSAEKGVCPRRAPARLRFVLFGLVLAPWGCDLAFTPPFSGEATDLLSTLTVREGDSPSLLFSGELRPGRAEDGTLRTLEDASLAVFGRSFPPRGLGHHGLRRYAELWNPMSVGGGVTEVRVPVVEGVHQGRESLPFGGCGRGSPGEVPLVPGDTLRFHAACDLTGAALRHVEWQLDVKRRDSGGTIASLGSSVAPPGEIAVPVDWLRQPGNPELEATLTIVRNFVWNDGPGEDYRIALSVRWVFPWTLRWDHP